MRWDSRGVVTKVVFAVCMGLMQSMAWSLGTEVLLCYEVKF